MPDPPQQDRAVESTRRLLEAATEVLAEDGIDKLTFAEVGRRAGFSHGLVTRRFGSKENFLWALFDSVADALAEPSIKKALAGEPGISLAPLLRALSRGLDEDPLNVRAFFTIMFEMLNSRSMPQLRSRMLHFNDQLRLGIMAAIRNGQEQGEANPEIDPAPVADVAVSALYGAAYRWILEPDYDFRSGIESLETILTAYETASPQRLQ